MLADHKIMLKACRNLDSSEISCNNSCGTCKRKMTVKDKMHKNVENELEVILFMYRIRNKYFALAY